MAVLSLPNTIDANTTADAVEVEQNFTVIRSYTNTDVIRRDGGVAMTNPLVLAGDPTADNHAATKNYVDAVMPIGTILMFAGGSAPAGDWHLCDGASLPAATYPTLYGVLGTRYGGSGSNFNLPNFAARVPVGVDSTQTRFDTTGKTGGNTLVPIPSHTHDINHNHGSLTTGGQSATHTHDIDHNHAAFTTASGGTHDHDVHFLNVTNTGTGAAYGAHVNWSGTVSGTTTVGTVDGAHTHSVDIPTSSGLASGGASVTHTHTVDLPLTTGMTSATRSLSVDLLLTNPGGVPAAPAVTTTTEHLPPYVVVEYIIRVDAT